MFAAYLSDQGCTFIDRQLYLPKDGTNKPERRTAAQVPDTIRFVTKPEIAAQMIERAITAGVPFNWVATDTIDGAGFIDMQLRRAGKGYGLGAHATDPFNSWGKTLLGQDALGGRHGRADRASPSEASLEAPVGWKRHQGTASL